MEPPRRSGRGRPGPPPRRRGAALALALLSALALGGEARAECGDVTIAEMTWASAAVAAHVQNIVLREAFGCRSELVPGDTVPTTSSMTERGEPDVAPEVWINSVRGLIERSVEEGRLRVVGRTIEGGGLEGWFVPDYMVEEHPELTTLQAVRARPDLFPDKEEPGKGRFYGCPSGWACEIINANLFRAYGMDEAGFVLFNPGSGEGLSAAIAKAYERREPVFAYYWSPTALLHRYSLVRLEGMAHDPETWGCITEPDCPDPAENMYPSTEVLVVVTSRFADAAPEAYGFVSSFSWSVDTVQEVLAWMDGNQATAEEAAEHFLRTREDVWTAWVSGEQAERVRAAVR